MLCALALPQISLTVQLALCPCSSSERSLTASYCIYKAISAMDDNALFAQIVISTSATFGAYVLSSLMFLDPWHLFTSMAQYIILVGTYVNVLNCYAFSNLHDFSWFAARTTTALTIAGARRM